jgi:hypothetical protein
MKVHRDVEVLLRQSSPRHWMEVSDQIHASSPYIPLSKKVTSIHYYYIIIWFVRLLALRPLLAYCASLG